MSNRFIRTGTVLLATAAAGMLLATAQAAPPVVKTVPWVATNPLIPHSTYSGKSIRLKGTADMQGAGIQYAWDFGDGSPVATGTIANRYAIEASHAYTGVSGTVFTARLTVQNTSTGETASKPYYVQLQDKSLEVEVNIAIDEGLWYLHKTQRRYTDSGGDKGDWTSGCSLCSGYFGLSATNVNAFEVNGHLENGSADNPYTETVARGMRRLFEFLQTSAIASTQTNPQGTFNPDTNGNGYGVFVNQSYPYYQGGMFMDAIVASGTPDAVTTTGEVASGVDPGVRGRTYRSIVQDMADAYSYCQYDSSPGGAWRYNCNEFPDQSVGQWAAIGLIAAEREWGASVPPLVKQWNVPWLKYTQATNGSFGYTSTSPVWGPYATTPSGMVQMALDGLGRGNSGTNQPSWDKAEGFMRDNFVETGSYATSVKDYYYGLFSFTKAMLLHDSNGDGHAEPITLLRSQNLAVNPIDWYAAERNNALPETVNNTNGVARTLVNDQNAGGYWYCHDADGNQCMFETAWAVIMLNRTVFSSGVPVAVAKATPNPGVVGQTITLDGADSFHQDAAKAIDSWEWDLNNDGTYDAAGPMVTRSFAALGDYPVRLRVCDNATPETCADTTITVRITTPPIAPTANADGPYVFCPQAQPWFLDGRKSINPDEGQSEPGMPGDTIQSYAWDLDGDGAFDDASGATPDVTAFYTLGALGGHIAQLRVTDTTAASFPSSGFGNLSSVASAQVTVKAADDPACSCVSNLTARPKSGKVQLVWTARPGAHHYNIYRGTISGGPYLKIGATASTYATYLDYGTAIGTTYYYVVREAALNDNELCQSNQARATPTAR